MKKHNVPAHVIASIKKEVEAEKDQIAKPIMKGLTRWIQTARWYWLVVAIVTTWPISILEHPHLTFAYNGRPGPCDLHLGKEG